MNTCRSPIALALTLIMTPVLAAPPPNPLADRATLPLPVSATAAARVGAQPDASTPAAAGSDSDTGGNAGNDTTSDSGRGVAIFGEHMVRHRRYTEDSAAASFNPLLPLNGPLLAAAMRSTARHAFGQHQIKIEDSTGFSPPLGRSIDFEDFDYAYRFTLDGTSDDGVHTIFVTRKQLPPPEQDEELLELLRQLEAM